MKPEMTSERKRILYVVHRYAPYPGGSENYVRDMAEETLSRGHDVWVFTAEHCGDVNGVRVSSESTLLLQSWDLIVVHGGDVNLQNFVLQHADRLGGPVLYLIILPSNSAACVAALHKCKYIGCSTLADWRYVQSYGVRGKSVKVRHGIDVIKSVGKSSFRKKYNINTKYMFLSAGGYWPNKGFDELVETFNSLGRTDVTLVLTGYDNRYKIMPDETEFVKPFLVLDRSVMLSALVDSDLYILNSKSEGFGLVLLESMVNGTPWAARNIAGAETLREYGFTYENQTELRNYLTNFSATKELQTQLNESQKFVLSSHQISHTVSDILRILA